MSKIANLPNISTIKTTVFFKFFKALGIYIIKGRFTRRKNVSYYE